MSDLVRSRLDAFLGSWPPSSAGRGASSAELDDLEERYHVRLPSEFRAYLERANGMHDADMDRERLIHFYGVDLIVPAEGGAAGAAPEGQHYFVFADFMVGSHEYAIALAGPDYGTIAIVGDAEMPRVVAESFLDFVDKYLNSPATLWGTG
jgi:hypothetical protein